jgi:hypothetical protein
MIMHEMTTRRETELRMNAVVVAWRSGNLSIFGK